MTSEIIIPIAHSEFGPSGSSRWIPCPGSVQEIRKLKLKGKTNWYAAEGSAAHELCAICLMDRNITPHDMIGQVIYTCDTHGPFKVTDEMANAVEVYTDHVFSYLDQNSELRVENRISLEFLHPGQFGTSDAIIIQEREIHVIDYKHGKGIAVEVEDNSQLQMYAIGTLQELHDQGYDLSKIDNVVMHIVQPRSPHPDGPVRLEPTTVKALRKFSKIAKAAIEESLSDNPSFGPGEKQCKWCDVAGKCRHLAEWSLKMAQDEFKDFAVDFKKEDLKSVNELSKEEISNILTHSKVFSNWLKSVVGFAQEELMRGREVVDHKLVRGRANRVWDAKPADIEILMLMNDIELVRGDLYNTKMKTPAQMEKLIPRAKKDEHKALAELINKPKGAITMAHISDKREAIEPDKEAEDDFADFAGEVK